MDNLLQQLQHVGVHYIKSDRVIILELLENRYQQATEIDMLIKKLLIQLKNSKLNKVRFECPKTFFDSLIYTKNQMETIGERVIYTRTFNDPLDVSTLKYEVWPISENNSISFLSEVMHKNFNDTKEFLNVMRTELPSQVDKMFTVYIVNNKPVGVVFPHIEPNTNKEGRIFWIGMHPDFLGKGLGKNLHLIGLDRLKNDFKAKSYLGMTHVDNEQMRKIMIANECIQNENSVISLQYSIKN